MEVKRGQLKREKGVQRKSAVGGGGGGGGGLFNSTVLSFKKRLPGGQKRKTPHKH